MPRNEQEEEFKNPGRPAISRRAFARRAAIASAAATLAPGALLPRAIESDSFDSTLTTIQSPQDNSKLSAEGRTEVEARVHTVLTRYGKRLSGEQKVDIRRLQTLLQPQLESLRAYSVSNGDSPALYLKPLVEREKRPARTNPAVAAQKH
ncbi:MAG TPA: hypothetical protein VGR03_10410 [Candidatus Acidoferrum sp.]|nr:hypothetical protein [Candidatus Acidoferrum sp.]